MDSPLVPFVKTLVEGEKHKAANGGKSFSEDDLVEIVKEKAPDTAKLLGIVLEEDLLEQLIERIKTLVSVDMITGTLLKDKSPHKEWARNSDISWDCWENYKGMLGVEQGFPDIVLRTIGDDTLKVLDQLGDPKNGEDWYRKGLVLGHVQSGKTSNYGGLINRAADAGYKIFIIIAGIHSNLRNQTQSRINDAFVDRAPANKKPISLTTEEYDFKASVASSRIPSSAVGTSLVFVIKKNVTILRNLRDWLKGNNKKGEGWQDMPLLMIDDEADHASINTNKEETDPTSTNKMIREILTLFNRKSYVAYTATPFANIFIHPDAADERWGEDLFPEDFLYALEAPSNYFGPGKIFLAEDEGDQILRDLTDVYDLIPPKHRSDDIPSAIPESLKLTIRTFVLARAIRMLRGDLKVHMSMLINVSPFADIQRQVKLLTEDYVDELRGRVFAGARMLGADRKFWNEMQELYEHEYGNSGKAWEEIRYILPDAMDRMRVIVDNSKSQERLNYDEYEHDGLPVIVVGGYTLSRGLTLEGLMTSYWSRNSKTYDALMQMGRWFGYRTGYEDLCRLWMSPEARGWYTHIAESVNELRYDVYEMAKRGMTPRTFGLKVRDHPDTLQVTASNKMRAAEKRMVRADLSGRLIETHVVRTEEEAIKDNFLLLQATVEKLNSLPDPVCMTQRNRGYMWHAVSMQVVRDFIDDFEGHPRPIDPGLLTSYLDALEKVPYGPPLWNVVLVSLKKESRLVQGLGELDIKVQRRTIGEPCYQPVPGVAVGRKQRVASRGIESVCFEDVELKTLEDEYRIENPGKNVPDKYFRDKMDCPLLMIHVLDLYADPDFKTPVEYENVVGWGASFPSRDDVPAEIYQVNQVWLEQVSKFFESEYEDE
ncbi:MULTISPECIES: Z1 domain-containing protein [unclassified Maridesulfovibrio]|uniref:Z1 domain-containing protein n=1 Tax=unclassified Maridesulfovibrio TaxID=2794999 RepID=UPI003B3E023F